MKKCTVVIIEISVRGVPVVEYADDKNKADVMTLQYTNDMCLQFSVLLFSTAHTQL